MMGDFPDCDIKVCDFEISRVVLKGTDVREILGTPDYVAPEILHYEPITLAADMWSLGVTTYVLLTGFSPFGGETDQETFCNISQAQLDFPDELFEDVSEEAKDFIKKLLVRNPIERMSAKECLRHPWIAKHRKTPLTPAASKTNLLLDKPDVNENRGRVGCSSCSQTPNLNKRNLRKYLSKSREALFEKVVSQHKLASELDKKDNSLRKSTLLNQYNKTRRLCESQMNLISKSRERQLLSEQNMCPNFSKSREKLYGLRSLSKSHEVLNLGLCHKIKYSKDSEHLKPNRVILRSETTDLSSLNSAVDFIVREEKPKSETDLENIVEDSKEDEQRNIASVMDDENDADKENSSALETKSKRNKANGEKCIGTRTQEKAENMLLVEKIAEIQLEDSSPSSELLMDSVSTTTEGNSSSTDSDFSGSCENVAEVVADDEPRFTVQQLISAYNRHQEVVTKTSLEVTMSINDNQENKIIPILDTAENHKFPTGPNALRLFIPNIDITMRKPRKRSSKASSITTITEKEENTDDHSDLNLDNIRDTIGGNQTTNPAVDSVEVNSASPSIVSTKSSESLPNNITSSLENLSSQTNFPKKPPKLVRSLTESNVNRTNCSTSFLKTLDKFNNLINEESKLSNKPSPKIRRKSNPALMSKQYF